MPSFTSFVNSTTIDANQMNTNFNFLQPDFNPFHAGGTLTTNVGKLGTAGSIWAALAVGSINAAGITTSGTSTFNGHVTFGSTSTFNGAATFATNTLLTPVPGGARYFTLDDTSAGTGALIIQSGGGSAGFGGAINLFSHTHATRPGQVVAGISSGSGGRFTVNDSGLAGGTDRLVVTAAGLVSIGHVNPTQTLDVNGAAYITGRFQFESSGSELSSTAMTVQLNGDAANPGNPLLVLFSRGPEHSGIRIQGQALISNAVSVIADGYHANLAITPGYSGSQTVTRHNYININDASVANLAVVTSAYVFRFDAAAGTHRAVDAATTKLTPSTVNAWIKINMNGTDYFAPLYTSKTT